MSEEMSKEKLNEDLEKALNSGAGPKIARFALACLGAIPVAGGAIGGIGGAWSEKEQGDFNKIFATWLKLQEDEIKEIGRTIIEVMMRIDRSDEEVQRRIESPEYLKLIKKCFRDWSAAESEEKRILIRNLLSNSASTKICSDDVVRMFINWIGIFSEAHFAVIREIYQKPGSTRQEIWQKIHGSEVREDSAEADLFKLLIYDLSTGHVIRQHKEKDYNGNFIVSPSRRQSRVNQGGPRPATSAFDDDKEYELTELGKQFVHYTMNEEKIVSKLESGQ
jgi:hypothetical protein